jgi:hypothetical protein
MVGASFSETIMRPDFRRERAARAAGGLHQLGLGDGQVQRGVLGGEECRGHGVLGRPRDRTRAVPKGGVPAPSETDKLAQKLGQLQLFIDVLSQECMGQLASFGPT